MYKARGYLTRLADKVAICPACEGSIWTGRLAIHQNGCGLRPNSHAGTRVVEVAH